MNIVTKWNQKMSFTTHSAQHTVEMDAKTPIGADSAMTPKELVVAGLAGCTAMDVIALMRKHKQSVESFEIETEVEKSTGGYPEVFTGALITFKLRGEIEPQKALEAVTLSQTKYCGVSAMLSKAFPIHYKLEVNGESVGELGQAFPES